MADFDLAIVGGGINGCGIARDAAGRGLKALLVEQGDLASATSSASTKLVHGGLRYLEHFAFRLVAEALAERETILRNAPHVVWPLRFVLPHKRGIRPAFLVRLGLALYDSLGGREALPGTRTLDLAVDPAGAPLKRGPRIAFEYSDCWVDDARLVALNALDASLRGASVRTHTRCEAAIREGALWRVVLASPRGRETVTARALVNAAGPWAGAVAERVVRPARAAPLRLVKGSHIVVRRLFDGERPYLLQNRDGRVVFAIPYEGAFTLIGTTDIDIGTEPGPVSPSAEEIRYLCEAANLWFRQPIAPADVVWSYAGVRPLYGAKAGKAQDATRDYRLDLDGGAGEAPCVHVFGGKVTTYRKLAESALALVGRRIGIGPAWTATAPLPGGDFPFEGFDGLVDRFLTDFPFLDRAWARRLLRAYGTRTRELLDGATTASDLGEHFGATLTAREAVFLMETEWAQTPEDILWRRSKLGLHIDKAGADRLASFMALRRARPAARAS